MNLRYQTLPEAAEEVIELMEDEEGWLTVQDVAELLDIEADEGPDDLKPVVLVLEYMVAHGHAYRIRAGLGDPLYRV